MIRTVKDRSELEKQLREFARRGGRVIEIPSREELQARQVAAPTKPARLVDLGPLARKFVLRAERVGLGK